MRVRGNTGIAGIAGRCGDVVAHHKDGVAFVVKLVTGDRIICDPGNVDVSHAQPARCVGSAT